jgi:hypothetical protein
LPAYHRVGGHTEALDRYYNLYDRLLFRDGRLARLGRRTRHDEQHPANEEQLVRAILLPWTGMLGCCMRRLPETRTRAFSALEWIIATVPGATGSIWPARRAGFALEECHADLPVPLRKVR